MIRSTFALIILIFVEILQINGKNPKPAVDFIVIMHGQGMQDVVENSKLAFLKLPQLFKFGPTMARGAVLANAWDPTNPDSDTWNWKLLTKLTAKETDFVDAVKSIQTYHQTNPSLDAALYIVRKEMLIDRRRNRLVAVIVISNDGEQIRKALKSAKKLRAKNIVIYAMTEDGNDAEFKQFVSEPAQETYAKDAVAQNVMEFVTVLVKASIDKRCAKGPMCVGVVLLPTEDESTWWKALVVSIPIAVLIFLIIGVSICMVKRKKKAAKKATPLKKGKPLKERYVDLEIAGSNISPAMMPTKKGKAASKISGKKGIATKGLSKKGKATKVATLTIAKSKAITTAKASAKTAIKASAKTTAKTGKTSKPSTVVKGKLSAKQGKRSTLVKAATTKTGKSSKASTVVKGKLSTKRGKRSTLVKGKSKK